MFNEENGFKSRIAGTLFGACAPIILSVILIPIASLILYYNPDPDRLILPVTLAILYSGSISGGYIAKLLTKSFVSSIASGAAVTALILIISTVIGGDSAMSPAGYVIAFVMIIPAFIAGALIRQITESKRPRRNRRRSRK
ncbi:MAG: hypothetical protein E7647_01400 [Ruminococcaceae bacterium]|nr:hypothetical protein [Oscillospiraceae bacterium]